MLKWERVKYHPATGLGEDGRYLTGSEKHLKVSEKAASEGAVLLKNDGVLPLNNGTKLALFGTGSVDYIKCGGGSGDVITKTSVSLYEGLKNREKEKKVAIFEEFAGFYMDIVKNGYNAEPVCPDTIFNRATEFTDTAVIVIKRYSYESGDIKADKGGYYLTNEEIALVDRVTNAFENVIVVLNVGSVMDLSYIANNPKIKAILLGFQAGSMGGEAWSKILTGDINPSGKLVDTIPMDYSDFPSAENFLESEDYVEYTEDIYVGYRYFETFAPEKVLYPFGYGLSYTDFDIKVVDAKAEEDVISFNIKVKNTGKTAGKEVVQVYLSAPGEILGRPKFELCGFKKTSMLEPEEEEVVTINFDLIDFGSFDDTGLIEKSAFILEKGEYIFHIGNSIRNTFKADFSIILEENKVVKTVKPCVAPTMLTKRLNSKGEYEKFVCEKEEITPVYNEIGGEIPEDKILLTDVLEGKESIENFVQQLYFDEKLYYCYGKRFIGVCDTGCFGDDNSFGVPAISTADGPAGMRVRGTNVNGKTVSASGVYATAFPIGTMLASSWNEEVMYEVGKCAATELLEQGMGIWLAPGMNIHRNPLCGRNFEYFSEDPFVTGKIAAAEVKGIQSMGVAATLKHFACNNKEVNRFDSDSRVSQRALREIYLKGFEIAVKESNPWCIMTSYNKINGVYSAERYDLLTEILRNEWGFDGVVMSDWGAKIDFGKSIMAGNDVKMPNVSDTEINKVIEDDNFDIDALDTSVKRIMELILKIN